MNIVLLYFLSSLSTTLGYRLHFPLIRSGQAHSFAFLLFLQVWEIIPLLSQIKQIFSSAYSFLLRQLWVSLFQIGKQIDYAQGSYSLNIYANLKVIYQSSVPNSFIGLSYISVSSCFTHNGFLSHSLDSTPSLSAFDSSLNLALILTLCTRMFPYTLPFTISCAHKFSFILSSVNHKSRNRLYLSNFSQSYYHRNPIIHRNHNLPKHKTESGNPIITIAITQFSLIMVPLLTSYN